MEEDIGVKGTVTRLRRRLSVESDDAKSPATQSTPTKKRGGRLAAKPQLELIDENAPETPSKKTRKPAVKNLTEPAEDKPVTPARRSTRVRSNTSILAGTPGEGTDDKPLTPARRSARSRSNTSLISDALTNVDSPRAKRAARRNSQLGSDTDAPVTPARQTRRTRKESASSIDAVEIPGTKVGSPINETISEEPENNVKAANNNDTSKNDSLSVRKSPRLKTKKKSIGVEEDSEGQGHQINEGDGNMTVGNKIHDPEPDDTNNHVIPTTLADKEIKITAESADFKHNISLSSANLIEKMDTSNINAKAGLNKTTSTIDETNTFKSRRSRTKSWTTISVSTPVDSSFYSDNEGIKRKDTMKNKTKENIKRHSETFDLTNKSNDQSKQCEEEDSLHEKLNISKTQKEGLSNNKYDESNKSSEIDGMHVSHNIKADDAVNKTEKIFQQSSTGIIQSLVYIDDSDSNTGSDKHDKIEIFKGVDDQCVPVIEHMPAQNSKLTNDYSCEPMDIDETIPNDITHIQPENAVNTSSNENDVNGSLKKSKRKSSLSNTETVNKSKNEDKSTLVLSQLKDASSQDCEAINNVEITEELSRSANLPTKNKLNVDKKNLSMNYSTSTPLQQKPVKKLGMPVNTSIITPTNKTNSHFKNSKDKASNKSSSINCDSSSSDDQEENEESLKEMIDDEAEEASASYESGDSRDDEERQYEEENAIKEKGETLNSDDEEYSDASDYEKGSFVVSSDMEDDDLLSGSGDDLSMSADELTMSAKSKKKFNDRKTNQQKKASREMFEARHKVKISDKKVKSKKQIISSDSEEEVVTKTENSRRRRINSSHDESSGKLGQKKTPKPLSESERDSSVASETEITISEENQTKNDPLIIEEIIKREPQSPQKSFNISTIEVIGREDVEKVDIDKNTSHVIQPNETTDPLQSTVMQNNSEIDEELENESLSENEEIKQNYDSMLKDLNKTDIKKIKKVDISLNLTKKPKQKVKAAVIDELNLTQIKPKKLKVTNLPSVDHSDNRQNYESNDKEDSSDSIDMKLLFPEDSNDVETFNTEQETKATLDKTKSDTNTFGDLDDNVNFFIDTTGTHSEEAQIKDSFMSSAKKKKKLNVSTHKNNTSIVDSEVITQEQHELNVSIKTSSKKKKNSESAADANVSTASHTPMKTRDISLNITKDVDDWKEGELNVSNKGKKKNKKKNSFTEDVINVEATNKNHCVTVVEEEIVIEVHSAKKNKNKSNISFEKQEEIVNVSTSEINKSLLNTSVKDDVNSAKKKKNKKGSETTNTEENFIIDVVPENINISTTSTDGKKKRNSQSQITDMPCDSQPEEITGNSEKRKKKKKSLDSSQILIKDAEDHAEVTPTTEQSSEKKKKQSNNTSPATVAAGDDIVDAAASPSSVNKKKKKTTSESKAQDETEINPTVTEVGPTQKRKRKSSGNKGSVEIPLPEAIEFTEASNESISEGSKKKKRKISHTDKESTTIIDTTEEQQVLVKNSKKKNKRKPNRDENDEDESPIEIPVARESLEVSGQSKTEVTKIKKRKHRDGDDNNNKSNKIPKQNSTDKVYVPRLPAEILKQLDDKPKEELLEAKKASVISTTSFVVEKSVKRKNKPSNYLEQSVYLNDEEADEEKSKPKPIKAKPKVLPFLPTASTSEEGFTTTFRVNIVPTETKFVAQTNNVRNFKNMYLGKKVKKLGTYEKYKRQVTAKLHKF